MSTINRLAQIIDSAYKNEDTQLMRDAYKEYQIANCYYPKSLNIFDAHTQQIRQIKVACGSCYHCMESKINEWVTRMYAHAEDFKNVYFVTLTYRSFVDLSSDASRLVIAKLKDAIWHRDAFNATKHYSYNPCILVKSHYQNFLKRLRKFTRARISYVLSGEYGHDYGRPHFHLILFSDIPITRADIVRAWSVCLWRSSTGRFSYRTNQRKNGVAYDFPIGRIDYNDLVSNGSFNTYAKVRVDGKYLDVSNCFAYVCKYVCKSDTANMKRVALAYNSLYKKEQFCRVFNNEILFKIAKDYLLQVGYPMQSIDSIYSNLKQLVYEKSIFCPSDRIIKDGVQQFEKVRVCGNDAFIERYPSIYFEFSDKFGSFCEFSRGLPIGSLYAARNISEFAQGVYTKPLLQDSSFVVPNYFRIKAAQYLYGLRKLHKTFKSSSYNLGGLVDLYRCFEGFTQNNLSLPGYHDYQGNDKMYAKALQDSQRCYFDAYTRERIILADCAARYYKYDRSIKNYVCTRVVPLSDFVAEWKQKLIDELDSYNARLLVAHQSESFLDALKLKMLDCGLEFPQLRDSFVKAQDEYLHHKQKDYDQLHLFVE